MERKLAFPFYTTPTAGIGLFYVFLQLRSGGENSPTVTPPVLWSSAPACDRLSRRPFLFHLYLALSVSWSQSLRPRIIYVSEEKNADRSSNFAVSTCGIDYHRLSRRDRRVFEASRQTDTGARNVSSWGCYWFYTYFLLWFQVLCAKTCLPNKSIINIINKTNTFLYNRVNL